MRLTSTSSFLLFLSVTTLVSFMSFKNVSGRSAADIERIISKHLRDRSGKIKLLRGRSGANKPRKRLPSDWSASKHPNTNLKCGGTYFVPKAGYTRFLLKSKTTPCSYHFLGARNLNCTVAMLCNGVIKLAASTSKGCTKEFIIVSDGSTGYLGGCGAITFDNIPRAPKNGGTDLHVSYKGESLSTPCVVFCKEDLSSVHSEAGIKTLKKLPKNKKYKGPEIESCECGKRRNLGRVVGGETALKFEFPWLGFLAFNYVDEYKRNVLCGATLISDTHAISAAHCFVPEDIKADELDFVLHAHLTDRKYTERMYEDEEFQKIPGWSLAPATDEDEGSIRVKIAEIVNHPLFDEDNYDFDIAVLKFKNKVDLKKLNVAPICLPTLAEAIKNLKDENMLVAGWGLPWEGARANARTLQKLDLPFIEQNICNTKSSPTFRHICAGYTEGGKDACTGDSGGPLIKMLNSNKNQYMLSGVVSAGVGCGRQNNVGIYSSVNEFMSWITYHTASDKAKWCSR